jgi:alginate O-acetyltransferase complex protein AlgI
LDTVVGVVAYSIQIYFDFSGYSDMAIGLAGMFGIKFQENFRRPYSSSSVTDFWRRWHISLSSWFKDYVYIPLGGNRKGSKRTYCNLVLIFVLTGLWHGANWTFLAWGLVHGTALILERYFLAGDKERPWLIRALLKIWTITIVMLGWLLFRAVDLAHAGELLSALGGRSGFGISPLVQAALTPQRIFWTCIGLVAFLLPKQKSFGEKLGEEQGNLILSTVALAGGALASVYVLSSSFSPFLYFQF